MQTFIATLVIFLGFFALMSLGYIIRKKAVHGSCGGIAGIGLEKECDCPEPCDNRKAKMAAAEKANAERNEKLQQNRII